MHYLLFYEKAPEHADREPPLATEHRAHLHAAISRGQLILGGPLLDPTDGSTVLLFRADTPAVVEDFAVADPYVLGGVVTRWQVRPWETVVGNEAACPLPGFEAQPS